MRNISLIIVSLFLGVIADVLLYGKLPGISVLLFVSLILGAAWFLGRSFGHKPSKSVLALAPLIVFFAGMVSVRASGMLAFFNIVLIVYLLLLVAQLTNRPAISLLQYTANKYIVRPAWLPLRFLRIATYELRELATASMGLRHKTNFAPYLRGIALSIPFLVLFLILLSSADLVFQKYVGSIFDINLNGELLFRILMVIFTASLFIGAYVLMFVHPPDEASGRKLIESKHGLSNIEATIMLGSVGVLFLTFVVIQAANLFAGSDYVSAAGVTYADYARRGFFQLIAVAVIAMALIWAVKKSVKHNTPQQVRIFKWLSGLLILEVLVIMASAHMRLSLYEEAYGFTVLRLLSHLFLGWLAITFASLMVYIMLDEPEKRFALRLFVSVMAFFALLNVINPDAMIARQNINRLESTGKLDVYYLQSLSEDATPTIVSLLNSSDPTLRKSVAYVLFRQQISHGNTQPWQSYNLARSRAQTTLNDNQKVLRENRNYYTIPSQFPLRDKD